eukprot:2462936-Pyramimonas_sp.AAC.1
MEQVCDVFLDIRILVVGRHHDDIAQATWRLVDRLAGRNRHASSRSRRPPRRSRTSRNPPARCRVARA